MHKSERGCPMNFLSKLFERRKEPKGSLNQINVVVNTDIDEFKEQKDAIISIVRDGIMKEHDFKIIGINIVLKLHIVSNIVTLNSIDNGVEVIIS